MNASASIHAAASDFAASLGMTVEQCHVLDSRTPERTTTKCDLTGFGKRRTIVAKHYGDRSIRPVAEAMQYVQDGIDALKLKVLRIPRLLRVDKLHSVVIQEFAAGVAFAALPNSDDFLNASYLAGEALAELHSIPIWPGRVMTLRDDVRDLIRPEPSQIAKKFPRFAETLDQWNAFMQHAIFSHEFVPAVIHRDFHLRQCFVLGNTMEVIDWDDAVVGDPAFDVGYLISYLKSHMSDTFAEKAIHEFAKGYSVRGDTSVFSRVRIYRAFNLVRRSARRLRLRDANWESQVREMLTNLQAELDIRGYFGFAPLDS
ncbi:MAG: aminoglycoside phosphotransferase family protein [Planctomycetales bacterium]|nr:aminoglycoside phosphotransferase family protein [Planctomycetales bacterium]